MACLDDKLYGYPALISSPVTSLLGSIFYWKQVLGPILSHIKTFINKQVQNLAAYYESLISILTGSQAAPCLKEVLCGLKLKYFWELSLRGKKKVHKAKFKTAGKNKYVFRKRKQSQKSHSFFVELIGITSSTKFRQIIYSTSLWTILHI